MSGTTALYDGMLQMVHPDRVVDEAGLAKLPLVEPVYPLTEGLSLEARCAARSMPRSTSMPDAAGMAGCRPGSTRNDFPPFAEALRTLHRPARAADVAAGEHGLVAARL